MSYFIDDLEDYDVAKISGICISALILQITALIIKKEAPLKLKLSYVEGIFDTVKKSIEVQSNE